MTQIAMMNEDLFKRNVATLKHCTQLRRSIFCGSIMIICVICVLLNLFPNKFATFLRRNTDDADRYDE